MPRVTVIIPTFNYAAVLPYAIGSALRQSFTDFELLVVGDHCTDESESVVRAIGDSRVRWINLPDNIGHQSGPNNRGLQEARGDLVAYLGHDDLWLPNHLARGVQAFDAGADLTFAIILLVEVAGRPNTFEPCELEHFSPGAWMPPSVVMHRREIALRVGGWKHFREVSVDPETDLWKRLHEAGAKFQFIRALTAVKFPAIWRKGVYANRPTHEQAEYSARIQSESDFAETELARLLTPTLADGRPIRPFREVLRDFREDLTARAGRRLQRLGLLKSPAQDRMAKFARNLKFKGVDHNSD